MSRDRNLPADARLPLFELGLYQDYSDDRARACTVAISRFMRG